MQFGRYLVAGILGITVAITFEAVWVLGLAPAPEDGLWPYLLVLVAAPTGVVVAVGTGTLAFDWLGGTDESGSISHGDGATSGAAISLVVSALGFAVVTTMTAVSVELQGFIALALGLALGTGVAIVLAIGVYELITPNGGSVFGAGTLGSIGIGLTVLALGVVGTFVIGILATVLLIHETGAVPQVPLLSIPIGIAGGLAIALVTALVLRWHVHRLRHDGTMDSTN